MTDFRYSPWLKAAGALAGISIACASNALAQNSPPALSVSALSSDFSALATLKPLAAQGKGKIGVLLPETTTSARYTSFDAPYLAKAFEAAGLAADQFIITNAQGSEATELTQAQSDISQGATVLVMDPISSGVGAAIETYAKSHGVPVIDYDRLTLGGSRKYYVSFNNVQVGTLLGQGLVKCISDWKVSKPQVMVMRGAPTDNNATLFFQGYNAVLQPLFSNKTYTDVANPAGTWDPPTALTEFQAAYTAHPSINAVLMPNDENGAPIIHYLQTKGIKAQTFPVTGQDATTVGLQNILSGYQCGTVYKPIYLEAQAAVALAMFIRAGKTPPASLVNGATQDSKANVSVPSVLLQPTWVTTSNMASTVIADKFVTVAQLCVGQYVAF